MEERYWELREECDRAFDKWCGEKNDTNLLVYKDALGMYQGFCVDILEKLMEENVDVLKNLKNNP